MDEHPSQAELGTVFVAEIERGYRAQKLQAERALDQLEAADWHRTLDDDGNSIAVIVRHLTGNLRSRWTDFLTSDGEKPDRNRDGEFESGRQGKEEMLAAWDEAFAVVFDALAALTPSDLGRTITIRDQPLGVVAAILRNYEHTGHHVGQIVLLAKHWCGPEWRTLSIPKKR
jgi:hypothetical protein